MKPTNGYISAKDAIQKIRFEGAFFRQNLEQTKFNIFTKTYRFKLNKKAAKIVKAYINAPTCKNCGKIEKPKTIYFLEANEQMDICPQCNIEV